MTRRVVIHAGLPKCGSSSLQLRLAGAQAWLRARDIAYPVTDPATGAPVFDAAEPDAFRPQHMALAHALAIDPSAGAAALRAVLDGFERTGAATLVLSSESFVRRAHRFDADALAPLGGYAVELLLFVRRRDAWLLSMYKQAVRAWARRWQGGFARWLADPPEYDLATAPLPLADRAARLSALTGGALRVFDLDAPGRPDTRRLAGAVLGVPLWEAPDLARVRRAGTTLAAQGGGADPFFNSSPSDAEALFLAMIRGMDQPEWRALNAAIAAHGFGDAAPRVSILDPALAARLVAGGAADRARLGLAPVTRPFDAGGREARETLTTGEWRRMADALLPRLDAGTAAALRAATVGELR